MQKIKYEFADGTTSEIEVTDEIYALHLQLLPYWHCGTRNKNFA